ncbi:MAG: zinc-ribbon domain-containing protein [Flavobacteriaceae bacterium]
MILFFGTKQGKKETKKLTSVSCPHCSQAGTLILTSHPNYAHLFWVPILKLNVSHYAECLHCKRVYYREEFTQEMQNAL